jgi:DNA invertase Pin-like site-specific DNA recombinase
MSNAKQDKSIPQQREAVESYAAAHGYRLIRSYQDEGISGDEIEKRRDFLRMQTDAGGGDFEAIIVWDLSRFSRLSPSHFFRAADPFRERGIALVTVDAGPMDWDTLLGEVLLSVNQYVKAAYLKDMSKNVSRGLVQQARRGCWLGQAPIGYRVQIVRADDGRRRKLVIDPERAELVRWIFKMYTTTETSLRSIALQLNERKVPTVRGAAWSIAQIRKILKCPTYTGRSVWNRMAQGKHSRIVQGAATPKPRGPRVRANGKEDWIVVDGTHEPIIDQAMFDAAQKRLAENHQTKPHYGKSFLFSGLVTCANCGSRMHASACRRNPKRPFNKYICSGGLLSGKSVCRVRTIREDALFKAFLDAFDESVFGTGEPDLTRQIEAKLRAASKAKPDELNKARAALARLDRDLQNAERNFLVAPPSRVGSLKKLMEELQERRDREAERLTELERASMDVRDVKAAARAVAESVSDIRGKLASSDPALVRAVVKKTMKGIRVTFKDEQVGALVRSKWSEIECLFDGDVFNVRSLVSEMDILAS